MSEYCKNCFELAEKLTKKERECNTLKSQLDFAVQQKECFEQLCEALKSEGFTRESLITEQEDELQLAEQLIAGILKTLNLEAYDWRADQNEILTEIKAFKHKCKELKKQFKQLKDTINEEKEAGYSIIERLL